MKLNPILFSILIASATISTANAALYTLANGDFETPVEPNGLGGYNGTPALAGFAWQIGSGDIDISRTYWQPASGAQSIDLNGTAAGSIYQDFTFSAAGSWTVMFAMSANPDSAATKTLNVSFGPVGGLMNSLGNYAITPGTRTHSDMQWVSITTPSFSAQDSVTYRLSFTSLIAGLQGPALDNVQLLQVDRKSVV